MVHGFGRFVVSFGDSFDVGVLPQIKKIINLCPP